MNRAWVGHIVAGLTYVIQGVFAVIFFCPVVVDALFGI